MKALTYKGYSARIEFDAEDELFVGHLAGIQDPIGFHADTVTASRTPSTKPWTTTWRPASRSVRIPKSRFPVGLCSGSRQSPTERRSFPPNSPGKA